MATLYPLRPDLPTLQVCTTKNTATKSSVDELTFGIELEFIVVSPTGCFANLPPLGRLATTPLTYIYHSLVSKSIPTKLGTTPTKWNPEGGKYTCWNVHHDHTLRLSNEEATHVPENHDVTAVELGSRILSLTADDWQAELATVLETVQSLRQFGCSMITNEHCGLHVHVGFGDQVVPLETCKTVFQVATAMERCFDQLHTASRIVPGEGLDFDINRHFNAPLSWFHRKKFEGSAETSVFHWLGAIEKCEDHQDLQDLFEYKVRGAKFDCMTNGHNSAINFDNCSDDPDPDEEDTGTIEFRQHEVLFCQDSSDLSAVRICARALDLSYTPEQMMQALGCDDGLISYCRQELSCVEYQRRKTLIGQSEDALDRGLTKGLEAMEVENAISKFRRGNILAMEGAIAEKLASGSYGKVVKFDPTRTSKVESAFHAHAAILQTERQSNLTAKGVAFHYMSEKPGSGWSSVVSRTSARTSAIRRMIGKSCSIRK